MVAAIEAVIESCLRARPQTRAELIGWLVAQYPQVLRDALERSLWRLLLLGRVLDDGVRLFAAPRRVLRLRRWYE